MDNHNPSKVPTQWHVASPVPVGWMRQFRYFIQMFEKIKSVPGNIVECGLGEGNTFAMLAYLIGSEAGEFPRSLYGFDSFEGWPDPTKWDVSPRNPQKGEWKVSKEMVDWRFEESGIYREFPDLLFEIIPGFFEETLPVFAERKFSIALLHIDADLYPGYRDALKYLFPLVVENGGIILLDEYREFPKSTEYGFGTIEKWPGATKAVDEHLASLHHSYPIYHHFETGKYYILK